MSRLRLYVCVGMKGNVDDIIMCGGKVDSGKLLRAKERMVRDSTNINLCLRTEAGLNYS